MSNFDWKILKICFRAFRLQKQTNNPPLKKTPQQQQKTNKKRKQKQTNKQKNKKHKKHKKLKPKQNQNKTKNNDSSLKLSEHQFNIENIVQFILQQNGSDLRISDKYW